MECGKKGPDFSRPPAVRIAEPAGAPSSHLRMWDGFRAAAPPGSGREFGVAELQEFAEHLLSEGYTSVNCYLSSVVSHRAADLRGPEPHFERRYSVLRRGVTRTLKDAGFEAEGAALLLRSTAARLPAPFHDLAVALVALGLRADSYLAVLDRDLFETGEGVSVFVRKDKVPQQEGRTISLICRGAARRCKDPNCGCCALLRSRDRGLVPISTGALRALHRMAGTSDHSFRRTKAVALRHRAPAEELPLVVQAEFGWAPQSKMYKRYSRDWGRWPAGECWAALFA